MYPRLLASLCVVASVATPAHAQRSRAAAASVDAAATFRPLVERYFTALATRNLTLMDSLYAADGSQVFFDIIGEPAAGWSAFKNERAKFLEQITALQLVPSGDLRATRQGSVAWTSTTFRGTLSSRQHGILGVTGRQTAVWERRGDWGIVHEHLSIAFPDLATIAERFPAPEAAGEGERSVREIFARYATAWNGGLPADLAALWHTDGDIVVLGATASTSGRDQVARLWSDTMARRGSGFATVIDARVVSLRMLEPDVAVVDGEFDYWKGQAGTGKPAAQERFTAVATRVAGAWRIATLRVAPVAAPPPPPPRRR
jgi:uncharacterized protein (TIGR02246 family)